MAKKLSLTVNGSNNLPVANAGLKLSKIIDINKIEEHKKFKSLYTINDELLERIVDNMVKDGFDQSQPVHIWIVKDENNTEHNYLIDGYTRIAASKKAGFLTVPYFEHHFENFEEAYHYVLHLQIDRRNLSGQEFMQNLRALMGSDYVQNFEGDKASFIAEELGVSERTVKKAISVENNASEEQKARISTGEASINQIYNENHPKKKSENKNIKTQDAGCNVAPQDYKDDITDNSFDDEINEALGDNEGTPTGLNFNHSDGIERPVPSTGDDTVFVTLEEKNIQCKSAEEKGFSDGFYAALIFVLSEIERGKSPKEVYNDERIADLSPQIICNFKLPEDAEEIVGRL